jgi:dihydroflavonol-4-reductase
MKIFLTGGTGFIGQQLTQALTRRGWEVTALVRKPDGPKAQTLAQMGVRCIPGDVTDRESMRTGMAGVDIVIHTAAWYEVGIPKSARQLMHNINVIGTENVLGLAYELGIPRTVYVSSCTYYGDTGTEKRDENYKRQIPYQFFYEQTKAEAHEVAEKYQQQGLPLIIVCPAHVFGANDQSIFGYFLRLYLNRLMVPYAFSPNTMFSPAHVDDVSEGIVLAAEKGNLGETYNLAGDPMSMREMFDSWAARPGGFKVRFYIPNGLALLIFAPMAPLLRMVRLPAFVSADTVKAGSISYNFSGEKAQRELGWSYRPVAQMWQDTIDGELELLAKRQKRDLASRLKPVDIVVTHSKPVELGG